MHCGAGCGAFSVRSTPGKAAAARRGLPGLARGIRVVPSLQILACLFNKEQLVKACTRRRTEDSHKEGKARGGRAASAHDWQGISLMY